jgi:hypothetical protein
VNRSSALSGSGESSFVTGDTFYADGKMAQV